MTVYGYRVTLKGKDWEATQYPMATNDNEAQWLAEFETLQDNPALNGAEIVSVEFEKMETIEW